MSLAARVSGAVLEAGVDEAGRGALAGPVVAAAVILPPDFSHEEINDSKQLGAEARYRLREVIFEHALAWNLGIIPVAVIDRINILQASLAAMQEAINGLALQPEHLAIDGNKFHAQAIPHSCVIGGDGKYLHIAAASILAKTFRDELMQQLHQEHQVYNWAQNKGYGTLAHRQAIVKHGPCNWHRRSFALKAASTLF